MKYLKINIFTYLQFIIIFLFLLIHNSNNCFAQTIQGGIPYIQNYDDKDYNTPQNQFWTILQDPRGIMYFGNGSGLLEFDGTNWQLIKMPNKSVVRSLEIDSTDRIYIGAIAEFGWLQADTVGTIQYVSLVEKISEKHRDFGDVWRIFVTNEGVVFQTFKAIYILKNDTIKVLEPEELFDRPSFYVNDRFYAREWGKGLLQLVNDSLHLIPGGEKFANEPVFVMLPYEKNSILIISRTQGIFIYSKHMGVLKPQGFEEADNFLIKNQIYCGTKINNEHFVLGTLQNGLIIINKSGNIIQHINKKKGLQDNSILSVYIDSKNNIWAGLDNGTSYLTLNLPFRLFNEKTGLQGCATNATVFKNKLYATSSLGIFCKDGNKDFFMLENTKGQSWTLTEIQGELFCGHYEGILKLNKGIVENIAPFRHTFDIIELINHPGFVIAGTHTNGLILLERKNGKLFLKNKIKGFDESSRYVQEDDKGNIWVSHVNKGVFRLKLNEALDSVVELSFYNTEHGLPSNTFNFVFKIKTANNNSKIIFGTENGIYEYNPEDDRFIPDTIFNNLLENKGTISSFTQDEKGNIYFKNDDKAGVFIPQNKDKYKLKKTPFLKLKRFSFEDNIIVIDTSNILFCTYDGIIHYNPLITPDYNASFPVLIRQVLANDSLIFGGMENTNHVIKLSYELNALQFTYSALYYEDHDKTQYSYFLKGFDPVKSEWSEWSIKTEKEYTNLPEGNYIFNVKAKNVYEKESTITQYKFKILPPWYRTIVAYIAYVVLAVLLIWLIVILNTRKLKKDKEKLEKIVKKRTVEVVKQKEEITIQHDKIEKAYQNIKMLSEIGKQITVNLSVEKIIETVYENVNTLMDASTFGIGIYNKSKNRIEFPIFIEKGEKFPFSYDSINEINLPGIKCFVNSEEIIINSFEEYEKHTKITAKIGEVPESFIYLPLTVKDNKIGVITVQSFQKNAYTDYHLNILQNIAVYTSIALENAMSYKKIENQKEVIEKYNIELGQQKEEIEAQRDELEKQRDIAINQNQEILIQKGEILEKNEELQQQKEELQTTLDNLQQTQQQLVESKKMASLGGLVAGIAHEINTPVGVGIAASSTLVKKSKQIVELFENKKMTITDLKNYVESTKMASELILTNLQRTGELVKSFKQVSVDQSSENQRQFNLKSYLEDIIRSLHPKLKNTLIQVEINCNKNIELNSYPGVFAQIFTNMIINSLTHAFGVKSEGKINISAITQKNNLILEYKDNGKGISPEILPEIFDPFFTTNMQKGTGLGLHIIYNLVTQKLNGEIQCKSEIQKGTEFIISIPI
ncbi:MAG: GAF domain-containing protein [Bacteroidales bacterium]|nr:GAF domain-containing protein [Bacteroidales bacterium]